MASRPHLSLSLSLSRSLSLSAPLVPLRSLLPSPLPLDPSALFAPLSFERLDDEGDDLSLPLALLPARSRSRERLRLLRLLDEDEDD